MAASQEGSADEQAAAWLIRLQSRSVSTAELEEFARWRREPGNEDAYDRAQTMWDASAKLTDDPDIQRALHGDARPQQRTRGQYVSHPALMLTTVAAAVVLIITVMSLGTSKPTGMYETSVGERSSLRLADGSALQLDTDSEIVTRLAADERRVTLRRGQAFFRVAHDATRPFVVDVGDGITVTAVGTEFDVQRTNEHVRVALMDGVVVVERAGAELARMSPGSVIEVAIGNGLVPTRRTAADVTSWRGGRLSFRDTPLADAVAEMNRYTDLKLRIGIPGARAEPVSGEFSVDDPNGFARAVDALLGKGTIVRSDASETK